MQKIFKLFAILFLVLNFSFKTIKADVPRLINYQGVLVDNNGKPLSPPSGTIKVTFTFFVSETGGSPIFTPAQVDSNLRIIGGLFSTMLNIPANANLDNGAWLEVQTDGQPPYPRIQIASTLYALNVADSSITSEKIRKDAVTNEKIKDLAITNEKIKDNEITGSKIKDNQINTNHIIDQSVTPIKIKPSIENGTVLSTQNSVVSWQPLPPGVPPGTVISYIGLFEQFKTEFETMGWYLCDGSLIDASMNVSADFSRYYPSPNLPDLQDRFLRGIRNGRQVGSYEADALQEHTHTVNGPNQYDTRWQEGPDQVARVSVNKTTSGVQGARVDTETRPKNIAVYYLIKVR